MSDPTTSEPHLGEEPSGAEDASVPLPADQAGAVDDAAPIPEAPPDPLAQAQRERDEYLDHLRRERAEFENFRKRATRERMDALDRGAQQVVASLLHVLDTFGLALAAAKDHPEDQLGKGVQMVHTQLMDTLKQAGLEEVDAVGTHFDPLLHEAMLQVEAEDPVEEPTVVEVLRPGYRFKGRVLRPASVKVAK